MEERNAIKIFEEKQVRAMWDGEQEKWYFSVIDVIAALTGNERPRKYWNDLKTKLLKEGSELSDKIGQLKLPASDGKFYKTDVADTEQLFRWVALATREMHRPIFEKPWNRSSSNSRTAASAGCCWSC